MINGILATFLKDIFGYLQFYLAGI